MYNKSIKTAFVDRFVETVLVTSAGLGKIPYLFC